MTRFVMMAVICGALVHAGGCGSVLFQDDFDADALNSPPNDTPPGAPAGDFIYWNDPSNGSVRVVAGMDASDHDLMYRKRPDVVTQRFVGFMSDTISPGARAFTATWHGTATLNEGEGPLDIWIGDAHLGSIAGVRLEGGRVLQRTGPDSYADIGALASGQAHFFVFTVDRDAETYSMSISGAGMETISTPNQAVLNADILMTSRPTIYLWFSDGGEGDSTYRIDEVRIVETDPSS